MAASTKHHATKHHTTPRPTMILTADDRQRLAEIRSMKITATLVLVGATVVFVLARMLEPRHDAWGYVRATAEAAMVGGIADWFAVTALFRHPLGIPIPHTAVLPRRKDQLGRTFGSFVQTSFLAPDVLVERLGDAGLATKAAAWLREDGTAELVSEKVASAVAIGLRVLDDDNVAEVLMTDVVGRLRDVDAAPIVGRALEVLTDDGRHHRLLDAALGVVAESMATQQPMLRRRLKAETPWWLPDAVEQRMFERAYTATQSFIGEIRRTPDHPIRLHLDAELAHLAVRLRESPELAARVNATRDEIFSHPDVQAWVGEIWVELRDQLIDQAADETSSLRRRLATGAIAVAHALETDAELAERLERATIDVVAMLAARYGDEMARFVEATVLRWDATETSTRIELLLGRDLQIIRINGSVVGGLAGLVIHTVGQLVG